MRFISYLLMLFGIVITGVLQFDTGFPNDFTGHLQSIFSALMCILAAWRLGVLLDRVSRACMEPWRMWLVGFATLSVWHIVLGTFSILYRPLAVLPLFILPFTAGRRRWFDECAEGFNRISRFLNFPDIRSALMGLFLLIALSWGFFASWVSVVGPDALSFHFFLADQALIRHSLIPPSPDHFNLNWQGFSTLILPALALDYTGAGANMLNGFFLILLAWACYSTIAATRGKQEGIVAALIVASSPLVMTFMSMSSAEIPAAVFGIASIHGLFFSSQPAPCPRRLAWNGFLLGMAITIKPHFALLAIPIALTFAPLRFTRPSEYILCLLSILALPSYWAFRSFSAFDLLVPPHYALSKVSILHDTAGSAALAAGLIPKVLHSFMDWDLPTFDGPLSPLFLLLPLLSLIIPNRKPVRLMLASACSISAWLFLGSGRPSELFPLFLVLALQAVEAGVMHAPMIRTGAIIMMIASTIAGIGMTHMHHSFFSLLGDMANPYTFIRRWNVSAVPQIIGSNELPLNAKIISVGEPSLFYLHREAVTQGPWELGGVVEDVHEHHDPKRLQEELVRAGYSHILFVPTSRKKPGTYLPPPCVQDESTVIAMVDSCTAIMREPSRLGLYRLTDE